MDRAKIWFKLCIDDDAFNNINSKQDSDGLCLGWEKSCFGPKNWKLAKIAVSLKMLLTFYVFSNIKSKRQCFRDGISNSWEEYFFTTVFLLIHFILK